MVMCASIFLGSASVVEQSLKEEQQRRSEAEEQVQLLKNKLAGELATSSIINIHV